MSLALQIAWRYFKRPADRLISAVGAVSVLGLVIGVMALVISMALMTGYREDLQKKLLAGNAELFVYSIQGNMANTSAVVEKVRAVKGVAEASPVVFQQALITSENHTTGEQVMIKGVQAGRAGSSPMIQRIVGKRGAFNTPAGNAGVSVGRYLAQKLRLQVGAAVSITVPSEHAGSFLPQSGTFVVTNIFTTGFFEFDSKWLFLDLVEAQRLLRWSETANLIEVKLAPGARLDDVVTRVDQATNREYAVTDWRGMNRQLFALLRIQQLVLFIVLGLIVFVSTFNIVSTLIMTAHEKRKEVGILMSMGADRGLIRRIFISYGTLVGLFGTLTGLLMGVVVCWFITRYKLISFGPEIAEVYFVESIPFITRGKDLVAIALFATLVSYLATILPALRASRLNPIDALRHE